MDEQKFEMVLFVDDQRILEAEQSHAPFNWRWDLTNVTPGRHHLIVNLVSATDHVGTFTAAVEVVKQAAGAPAAQGSPQSGLPARQPLSPASQPALPAPPSKPQKN